MNSGSGIRFDSHAFFLRDGSPGAFDVFRPNHDVPLPVVFCIHGGGWVSGDRSYMHPVAEELAGEGFVAICVGYRLAPSVRFPTPIEDMYDAAAFVASQSNLFGVDWDRRASFGNSAGGHMAAMLGLAAPEEIRVKAVVDLSGVSDVCDPALLDHPVCREFLPMFLSPSIDEDPELFRLASPARLVFENPPPFYIAHGTADDIVPYQQSEILNSGLSAKGGLTVFDTLQGEGHSYGLEAWEQVRTRSFQFLREHLK